MEYTPPHIVDQLTGEVAEHFYRQEGTLPEHEDARWIRMDGHGNESAVYVLSDTGLPQGDQVIGRLYVTWDSYGFITDMKWRAIRG